MATSQEAMEARHAEELSALRAKNEADIAAATGKPAKKKAKAAAKKAEEALIAEQEEELNDLVMAAMLGGMDLPDEEEEAVPAAPVVQEKEPKKGPSRREKRQAKNKAAAEKRRAEAEEEARNAPKYGEMETAALNGQLSPLNLCISEVKADGHCMYRAVEEQLGLVSGSKMPFMELRKQVADHLRSQADEYLPFMFSPSGDMMSPEEYSKYCDDVEKTAAWGGQVELKALAAVIKHPITVYAANAPPVNMGEEFAGSEPLRLSYHRHAYGLGEHYNSVVKA